MITDYIEQMIATNTPETQNTKISDIFWEYSRSKFKQYDLANYL